MKLFQVLSNRERLLRRAHTRRDSNRSLLCLSPTEENGIEPNIYDDSDFFQLLLKEVSITELCSNITYSLKGCE